MSSFTDPLLVEITQGVDQEGRALARLIQQFHYYVDDAQTDIITVPVNFMTDFASIPWWMRWWIPVLGRSAKAAVLHDFLLWQGKRSKAECAKIFLHAMTILGVSPVQRLVMYVAVRYWPFAEKVKEPLMPSN